MVGVVGKRCTTHGLHLDCVGENRKKSMAWFYSFGFGFFKPKTVRSFQLLMSLKNDRKDTLVVAVALCRPEQPAVEAGDKSFRSFVRLAPGTSDCSPLRYPLRDIPRPRRVSWTERSGRCFAYGVSSTATKTIAATGAPGQRCIGCNKILQRRGSEGPSVQSRWSPPTRTATPGRCGSARTCGR